MSHRQGVCEICGCVGAVMTGVRRAKLPPMSLVEVPLTARLGVDRFDACSGCLARMRMRDNPTLAAIVANHRHKARIASVAGVCLTDLDRDELLALAVLAVEAQVDRYAHRR